MGITMFYKSCGAIKGTINLSPKFQNYPALSFSSKPLIYKMIIMDIKCC